MDVWVSCIRFFGGLFLFHGLVVYGTTKGYLDIFLCLSVSGNIDIPNISRTVKGGCITVVCIYPNIFRGSNLGCVSLS